MSTYVHARAQTFEASAAIGQDLRVKIANTGKIAVADKGDTDIGTAAREAFAAGDDIAVNLATGEGTCVYVAAVALVPGDKAYGADGGKVWKTATDSVPLGIVLTTAAIDGKVTVLRRQI